MNNKKIVIFSGGVSVPIADHFSVSANAYGGTGRRLQKMFQQHPDCKMDVCVYSSLMADNDGLFETHEELKEILLETINDLSVKVIVFNCALPNFGPLNSDVNSRIKTTSNLILEFKPLEKLIKLIRKERKDIFLVGFKTTLNADKLQMYNDGCKLLKESSANLILVNDRKNMMNMIVTPEESIYDYSNDRNEVLKQLVDMTMARSHLSFTKSTVMSHEGVAWTDERIPNNLREVVDWCISQNAYKEGYDGSGVTVGHFACKVDDTTFITSKRKTNFNDLKNIGMVLVKTDGPDSVLAYGGKPSVGGQSQRIIFSEHEGLDCIVHFHCPLRTVHVDDVPVASQKLIECGSHACGINTSNNLKQFNIRGDLIKAVYLDQHGPNIVFSKDVKAENVIQFITDNFDLKAKTNGFTY